MPYKNSRMFLLLFLSVTVAKGTITYRYAGTMYTKMQVLACIYFVNLADDFKRNKTLALHVTFPLKH